MNLTSSITFTYRNLKTKTLKKLKTMATLTEEQLVEFFENHGFNVNTFEKGGVLCAEIEKWTDGGVDMIVYFNPLSQKSFSEYVKDFSVDEEISFHRQGDDYCRDFTIKQSLKDFTRFHKMLKSVDKELRGISTKTKVKQERVIDVDKLKSALSSEYEKSYGETKEGVC